MVIGVKFLSSKLGFWVLAVHREPSMASLMNMPQMIWDPGYDLKNLP